MLSHAGYHRSRVFKVSASLLLSTAYFVAAIGVWMVQQGRTDITADTASSTTACTPANQQTETFDSYPITDSVISTGQPLTTIPGWTVTGGGPETLRPSDPHPKITQTFEAGVVPTGGRHISSAYPFKANHAFAPRRSGEVAVRPLWGNFGDPRLGGAQIVTLSGDSGPVIRVTLTSNSAAPPSGPTYTLSAIDLVTGGSTPFTFPADADGIFLINNGNSFAPPAANTLHFRWSPSGYDLLIGERKLNGAALNLPAAGLPIKTFTLEVTGQPSQSIGGVGGGTAGFDDVTLPAGDVVPCVTGIAPAKGPAGTVVTLSGSQFEPNGMQVTMKSPTGGTLTIDSGIAVAADTESLTFTVPSGANDGPYQVGVTNAEGASSQTQTFTVGPPICEQPKQATDTFNEQRVVSGGGIPVPTGWTADVGTVLAGYDRNISRDDPGDAWMRISGRIQRPVRESREGQITFRLASLVAYNVAPIPAVPAFDVTLLTKSGPPLALRIGAQIVSQQPTIVSTVTYRDPLTGEYRSVDDGQNFFWQVSGAVNKENTLSAEHTFTIRWDGTTFTLDSPFGGTSKSYRYAQNDATSITGISLSGQAADSATQPVMANLLAKDVVYPAGPSAPCVSGIAPASGPVGTVVTLTGSQFETSGMKVTLKPATGDTITLESGITVAANGTSLTFKIPATTKVGPYQIGVITSAGASPQSHPFTVTDKAVPTPSPSTLSLTVDPTSGNAPLTVTATASVTVGLVGHWTGDGTPTDVVSGKDGTAVGGVTYVDGKVGKAFRFNGTTGSVVVPDSPTLRPTNAYSLAAWINPAVPLTDPAQGGIVSKVGCVQRLPTCNVGYQFGLTNSNQTLQSQFSTPGGSWYPDPDSKFLHTPLSTAIPTNQWTHVATTFDGTTLTNYVNGAAVGSKTVGPATVDSSGASFRISGDDNGNVFWNGAIDDVRIYSRGLSESEIRVLAGVPSSSTFNFGDGSEKITTAGTSTKHTYTKAGTYTVTLTAAGQTATQSVVVSDVVSAGQTSTGGGAASSSRSGGDGNGPAESASKSQAAASAAQTAAGTVANAAKLVASGGSLAVNLAVATLLAFVTTYGLLRRKQS